MLSPLQVLTDLSVIAFTVVVTVSALAAVGVHLLVIKHIEYLRKRERWIAVAIIVLLTILWMRVTIHIQKIAPSIATGVSCPIKESGVLPVSLAAFFFCASSVGGFALLVKSKRLRFAFVLWGGVISLLCLYNLGWADGAEILYGQFQIVALTNSAAQLSADTRMLVLGADDKNLVVLVRGYHQPQYLSRSDTKTFRIVGLAKIDDFVCKP